MTRTALSLDPARPLVAGSFGNAASVEAVGAAEIAAACDIAEIRLDLLEAEGRGEMELPEALAATPLLFTARRGSEGGAGDLTPARRMELLEARLDRAALVDVEVQSAEEMGGLLEALKARGIPWVASWHDFEGSPGALELIPELALEAAKAGAACFKAAVRLHAPEDLVRISELLLGDAPLPLALMGMGPLAPVSRLLAAQCGSVLNYGYLGDAPTAPGQWSAALLKAALGAVSPIRGAEEA